MGMLLPSEGVKDILVAAGVGVFAPAAGGSAGEWVIVISRMKSGSGPDQQICVMDGVGETPEHALNVEYPGVQVLVRGAPDGYKAGWSKASAVKDALRGHPRVVMGVEEDVWAGIRMSGDIMFLGYDTNDRPMFSLNFVVTVHRGDVAGTHVEDF